MSELHKFIFDGLPVRGQLVRLTDAWQEVLRRRAANTQTGAYPPPVAEMLGEMTAAAVLMQSNIKFDGALIMQIFGDGPVKVAVAEVQPDMPEDFYRDWLRVAIEEAYHFKLLHEHLRMQLGHAYGDFPAHDGLWAMCEKTKDDITARMALVPRTLEARGLDATPLIQNKLRAVGTPDALAACDILDVILRDEIGHVAIGNRWYGWLCERQSLEPVAHYRALVRQYGAPRLKGPFNTAARQQAGFSAEELAALTEPAAS